MAQKLGYSLLLRVPFRYFWGPPKGPKGVAGRKTSESSQGVYERMLEKLLRSPEITKSVAQYGSKPFLMDFLTALESFQVLLGSSHGP